MIRSNIPLIPSSLATVFCLALFVCTARAQTTPAEPGGGTPATAPATPVIPPADTTKTLSQLADLDLLTALTPLALNTTQIDALVSLLDTMTKAGAEIEKKNAESLGTVADDIDKARTAGLKGTPPDPDARKRIGTVLDEIDKRLKNTHTANIKRMVLVAEQTLTPEQIKLIETQYVTWTGGKIAVPGKFRDDPDGRKVYVQELTIGEYADRILLSQRAIDLLRKLRESAPPPPAAPETTPPPAAPAAATSPAAP